MTEEQFWGKVDRHPTGCWLWTGNISVRGYGRFGAYGRTYAHRFAASLTLDDWDPTKEACHRCDNPPCVRPSHLFTGTQKDNIRDAVKKRRLVFPEARRGERNNKARLTEQNVREIRNRSSESRILLEREFGVGRYAIYSVITRKSWAWLKQ